MTVSLIITTYNWPRALYLCLDSVMQQTVMPSEILVADDGSGISTRDVVRHFQNISPVPVHHIWHEDRGFRVAAIRNKAIAASSGDYIIHVDGDLILQRNFIQDHILFAREGCYVSGSRGIITEMLTEKVLSGEITSLTALTKGVRNSNNVMRVPIMAIVYRMIAPSQALEPQEMPAPSNAGPAAVEQHSRPSAVRSPISPFVPISTSRTLSVLRQMPEASRLQVISAPT